MRVYEGCEERIIAVEGGRELTRIAEVLMGAGALWSIVGGPHLEGR